MTARQPPLWLRKVLHGGLLLFFLLPLPDALGEAGGDAARPGAEALPDTAEGPVRTYAVTIQPTGDAALDDAIENVSVLRRLRERVPTSAEGLVARALQDGSNLRTALRSQGYYGGTPRITLAGEPADMPGLAQRLAARGEEPVPVVLGAETGPQYRISSVTLRPAGPEADMAAVGEVSGLEPGDPARAAAVNGAQEALVTRLREAGFPFAGVPRREITVDHDHRTMEVVFHLATGPRASFARPRVEGAEHVDARLLDRVAGVLEGERYDPRDLDRVRRDVLALGVFGTVRARTGEALDPDGRLPVTFLVAERPFRALGVTAAYETRLGPTGRVYWEHRNLFGAAERLRLEAELSRTTRARRGTDFGYRVGANLRQPWFAGLNVTAVHDVAVLRERLLAYDRDAITAGVSFERRLNPRLTASAGLTADIGRTAEVDQSNDYKLVSLPLGMRLDEADSLLDPSRGYRANLLLSPTVAFGGTTAAFLRARATGSAYFDLSGDRGTVLAVRLGLGQIFGEESRDIPPHLRFYAGGGGSVRGYDYQRIGPRRSDGTPRGGVSLVEGSVELRQRITGPYGVAVFVDAGSVTDRTFPTLDRLRIGAGAGFRYTTAIGPIRADVAVPLVREAGNNSFGLYVGIGQAF